MYTNVTHDISQCLIICQYVVFYDGIAIHKPWQVSFSVIAWISPYVILDSFLSCNELSTNCVSSCTWPSLVRRRTTSTVCSLTFKHALPLHTSSNGDVFQPRTERRIGDRVFSVAVPRAWNRLPAELKLMRSSLATFRRHLKSFLFRTSDWLCNAPSGWL